MANNTNNLTRQGLCAGWRRVREPVDTDASRLIRS
jgi:hypothetical protein